MSNVLVFKASTNLLHDLSQGVSYHNVIVNPSDDASQLIIRWLVVVVDLVTSFLSGLAPKFLAKRRDL